MNRLRSSVRPSAGQARSMGSQSDPTKLSRWSPTRPNQMLPAAGRSGASTCATGSCAIGPSSALGSALSERQPSLTVLDPVELEPAEEAGDDRLGLGRPVDAGLEQRLQEIAQLGGYVHLDVHILRGRSEHWAVARVRPQLALGADSRRLEIGWRQLVLVAP